MIDQPRYWTSPNGKAYHLIWCEPCHDATIQCTACENTSCNAGGCGNCLADFEYFTTNYKYRVFQYLTTDENKVYEKALQIKKFLLDSLAYGEKEINWKRLRDSGEMSRNDEEVFKEELK